MEKLGGFKGNTQTFRSGRNCFQRREDVLWTHSMEDNTRGVRRQASRKQVGDRVRSKLLGNSLLIKLAKV